MFHTIDSEYVWEIPLYDLVYSNRGERNIRGMLPMDAFRVGMEFERLSDKKAMQQINALKEKEGVNRD